MACKKKRFLSKLKLHREAAIPDAQIHTREILYRQLYERLEHEVTGFGKRERVSCRKVGKAEKVDAIQRLLPAINCYRSVL